MKSAMLSVEQNVPPVPEPPQRLAEVGHREPVCVPRGGIYEERCCRDAKQTPTLSVEYPLKKRKQELKHFQAQTCSYIPPVSG